MKQDWKHKKLSLLTQLDFSPVKHTSTHITLAALLGMTLPASTNLTPDKKLAVYYTDCNVSANPRYGCVRSNRIF
jgi:hypothetical protein